MQNKKRLHGHLLFIYILFLVVLVLGFSTDFVPDFIRGFRAGGQAVEYVVKSADGKSQRFYHVDAPVISADGASVAVEGLPANILPTATGLDLLVAVDEPFTLGNSFKVMGNNGFCYLLLVAEGLMYLVVLVLIALIINSLRKSVRAGESMRRSNIWLTRMIGILIIVAEMSEALNKYLIHTEAARLLEGTSYEVVRGFPLNYWNVIVGVLFLFMAEVFALGVQLSEDQKLTI